MSFKSEFSKDVFHARDDRGWTQQYTADRLSIPKRTYQNIELGKTSPRLATFVKLVLLFKLNIEDYREALGVELLDDDK